MRVKKLTLQVFTAVNYKGYQYFCRILQDGTGNNSDRRDSCRLLPNTTPSITGPQPADEELQRRVQTDKMYTIQLMMEKQTREIEEIRSQLAR